MFKEIATSLIVSTLVSSVAFAQGIVPEKTFVDRISVSESFSMVNYKETAPTLMQFLQGVQLDITDTLTASLEVPVYSNGTTDLGAIEMNLIWSAWENSTYKFALNVGVSSPMDTTYGAGSVDPSVGGVFTALLPWGGTSFVQSFDYEFVTDNAFSLPFGSKVTDDILTGTSSILCPIGDQFAFGANVWQNYTVVTNGQQNILAGPNATWTITPTVVLSAEFAVPVYQNVTSVEQNYVLSTNLGIKF